MYHYLKIKKNIKLKLLNYNVKSFYVIIFKGDIVKALITGGSSGIGKDMAYYLSNLGYDLIIVGKSKKRLEEVKNNIN